MGKEPKMSNPLISVIVPVYNVEKYIERCIESILGQTFTDFELIIVNDGSTDKSGEICDRYSNNDPRIRIIHKENGGLSDARNAGIEAANGEYIGFIDSDDYIDTDMYELLYQNICRENADISTCGIYDCYPDKTVTQEVNSSDFTVDGSEAVRLALESQFMPLFAWNKLYKRSLFDSIRFPVGKIYEDAFVMIKLMGASRRVSISMKPKYYYIHRENSITTRAFRNSDLDVVEAHENNFSYIEANFPQFIKQATFRRIWSRFHVLDKMIFAENDTVEQKKEVISFLRNHIKDILQMPWFSKSRKLSALCLCIHEKLYKACVQMNSKSLHK